MTRSRPAIATPIRLMAWLAALIIVAALVGMQAPPARAATGEVLYGANGAGGFNSHLYILNPANGAIVQTVGPIGFPVTGLAVHPTTGILYGTTGRDRGDFPGFLITINKVTGAGTVVGDLRPVDADSSTIDNATAPDITFGANGTLYGWMQRWYDDGEIERSDLATINLTTGLATIVGDSTLRTFGDGLAGSGNPLTFAGQGDAAADGNDGCLYRIDTGTGQAVSACTTLLGLPDSNAIAAADFNAAGTLFAVREADVGSDERDLITINTVSGAIAVLGKTVDRLDAIAFNPAQPLVATKTADQPTSPPAGGNGYAITISNPNAGAATVTSITDTLPAGFSYVAGSTTGATTANPSIVGSVLTWTGLFNAPAGGTVALSFDVKVSAVPGTYLNAAGGTAEGNSVTGTGPTASIVVTAPAATPTPTPAPAAGALPDAATGGADGGAGSSGWLLALGLLLGIAALSLRRSRSRAAIRGR